MNAKMNALWATSGRRQHSFLNLTPYHLSFQSLLGFLLPPHMCSYYFWGTCEVFGVYLFPCGSGIHFCGKGNKILRFNQGDPVCGWQGDGFNCRKDIIRLLAAGSCSYFFFLSLKKRHFPYSYMSVTLCAVHSLLCALTERIVVLDLYHCYIKPALINVIYHRALLKNKYLLPSLRTLNLWVSKM